MKGPKAIRTILVNSSTNSNLNPRHCCQTTHTHTHTHIYIYVCVCVCVCDFVSFYNIRGIFNKKDEFFLEIEDIVYSCTVFKEENTDGPFHVTKKKNYRHEHLSRYCFIRFAHFFSAFFFYSFFFFTPSLKKYIHSPYTHTDTHTHVYICIYIYRAGDFLAGMFYWKWQTRLKGLAFY